MKLAIKKILIPTDFSETGLLAVEHAAFMARLFKADLYLLHAIEISDTTFSVYEPAIVIPDLKEVEDIAFGHLNRIAGRIKKEFGIRVKIICTRGNSAAEIVTAVKENTIDIVVMGTHGARGFNEYFVGSNTHKTVTICPCPVISVQSHAKKPGFGKIVLPIDNSPHSRQKVDHVIFLAKRYASRIYILGLQDNLDAEGQKKFRIKLESVEKAITKAGLSCESKTIKENNLAMAALKYSYKVKADLIAVLSGRESSLTGIFLGPFSKQIINHSKIPVLTIKEEEGKYDMISLAAAPPY
jgi:nucleotide-binding universal stress UspA family protein